MLDNSRSENGPFFQFVARPGNVDNYGFNFTLRHPLGRCKMTILKIWSLGQSVLRRSCFRPKYIGAKVGIRPKHYLGWSIPQAEMCLGPKYAWGQIECGAKVLLGPNWVWAELVSGVLECTWFRDFQRNKLYAYHTGCSTFTYDLFQVISSKCRFLIPCKIS